jgi:hypothetical protein
MERQKPHATCHMSHVTRHTSHVTPVSIECKWRADENGHDALEHAKANSHFLGNGAG